MLAIPALWKGWVGKGSKWTSATQHALRLARTTWDPVPKIQDWTNKHSSHLQMPYTSIKTLLLEAQMNNKSVLPFNKNLKTTSVLDKQTLFQDNIGMWLYLTLKPKAGIVQLLKLNWFWENAWKCLTMVSATLSRNWEGWKLQAFSRHIRA